MDERQWNKARELADAFGDTSSESVAFVLGSALIEALSELLDIPLEGGEVVEDKRLCDAPAALCGSTSIDGHECSRMSGHAGGHHDKNGVGWLSTLAEPMSAKPNGSMLSGVVQPACEFCGGDHRSRCSYCSGHHPEEDIHDFKGDGSKGVTHPEFLEGEAAYMAAPVGTRVGADESGANDAMRRESDGWYCGPFQVYTFKARRPVEQWGSGV